MGYLIQRDVARDARRGFRVVYAGRMFWPPLRIEISVKPADIRFELAHGMVAKERERFRQGDDWRLPLSITANSSTQT
jgi:hypothetical protein